jgi:hypothetical protein
MFSSLLTVFYGRSKISVMAVGPFDEVKQPGSVPGMCQTGIEHPDTGAMDWTDDATTTAGRGIVWVTQYGCCCLLGYRRQG